MGSLSRAVRRIRSLRYHYGSQPSWTEIIRYALTGRLR